MPNFDELDPFSPLTKFSMFLMSLPLGVVGGLGLGLGEEPLSPLTIPSCWDACMGGEGVLEGTLVVGGGDPPPDRGAAGGGDIDLEDDNKDEAAEGCF